MIAQEIQEHLLENQAHFLIPADKVAHVMDQNPLSHALLVLSKVKYSRIPVLDKEDRLVGLIGLSDVVDEMLALTEISTDGLDHKCVRDVMDTDVFSVTNPEDIEYLLHASVDHSFIPVTDEDEHFLGIVTRRTILKAVNHLLHTCETLSKTV
ncbi:MULTISPECIES: cyclic-di-AMP-binding protein CbpB [Vagococcus]|uniref:CBS domain-containing protein n=1 Tax=Vagococcus lutrae LBD1 TaxID=1408226 RepID=V6Q5T5_9ENTE|nr:MULTISPECIES: cyclic-di-AMP-binding protein CbpB [Vagococcus]EST90499.1 hypothetical protein T233_00243 [Vagococcus lutrae LBD1]HCT96063.1 CBS domain-containing protein [Vagococcus sp.]